MTFVVATASVVLDSCDDPPRVRRAAERDQHLV